MILAYGMGRQESIEYSRSDKFEKYRLLVNGKRRRSVLSEIIGNKEVKYRGPFMHRGEAQSLFHTFAERYAQQESKHKPDAQQIKKKSKKEKKND